MTIFIIFFVCAIVIAAALLLRIEKLEDDLELMKITQASNIVNYRLENLERDAKEIKLAIDNLQEKTLPRS